MGLALWNSKELAKAGYGLVRLLAAPASRR
jgi:hypothetical protein